MKIDAPRWEAPAPFAATIEQLPTTFPVTYRPPEIADMKYSTLSLIAFASLSALPIACGGDHESTDGEHGAAHAGSASAGSGGATTSGGASSGGAQHMAGMAGEADAALEAPVMKSVEPLAGVLHVTWTNVTPDCDKVVLLRSKDGGEFATAYTLTGSANSQHDGQAKPPGEYCYMARCTKGELSSADSGEKCGTP